MYLVTQVTGNGTTVDGSRAPLRAAPKGRCRRGVGTGPFRFFNSVRKQQVRPRTPYREHMAGHISLLTDYGVNDEFVGVVKSVIVDLAPHVRITDLTHGVKPFDVRGGSLALARAVQYVPDGVIVAIVDPGVGSSRRAVAVEVAGGRGVFVGPDNGLLGPAVALAGGAERAFELTNTELHLHTNGATFAGRDVFAPVAAHLASGGDIADVGREIDVASLMPGLVPIPTEEKHDTFGEGLHCEVAWVDTFGNCQLNVGPEDIAHLGHVLRLVIGDDVRSARVVTHFAEIDSGAIGAVIDSYGMIALAMDRSSASVALRVEEGDEVLVFRGESDVVASPVTLRETK
ncbi:MAG: hypothetical protein RIR69_234 [Actinomycetota bacterium]